MERVCESKYEMRKMVWDGICLFDNQLSLLPYLLVIVFCNYCLLLPFSSVYALQDMGKYVSFGQRKVTNLYWLLTSTCISKKFIRRRDSYVRQTYHVFRRFDYVNCCTHI